MGIANEPQRDVQFLWTTGERVLPAAASGGEWQRDILGGC